MRGTMWLIVHHFLEIGDIDIHTHVNDRRENPYELERSFPFAELSGINGYLYRKRGLPSVPAKEATR